MLEGLAHGEVGVGPAALQDDADAAAQIGGALARVVAEHGHLAAVRGAGALRGSRRSSSCPRRWARAARTPRRGGPRTSALGPPRGRRRPLTSRSQRSRRAPSRSHHGNLPAVVCGCIDIGSNTTRLLVADASDGRIARAAGPAGVHADRQGPEAGRRDPARQDRGGRRRRRLPSRPGRRRPAPIRCAPSPPPRSAAPPTATSSSTVVSERGGVEVTILDGEEEARLAFLGATRTLGRVLEGAVGVVDVGGGSTEIAVGTAAEGVSWWASFRLGSGHLADEYLRSDPPTAAELEAMRAHAASVLGGARRAVAPLARWRSAAARPRCAGSSGRCSTSRARARALDVLARRPGRRGRRAVHARSRAGPAAAGGDADPRGGLRAPRLPAASSAAAACARASCSSWPVASSVDQR